MATIKGIDTDLTPTRGRAKKKNKPTTTTPIHKHTSKTYTQIYSRGQHHGAKKEKTRLRQQRIPRLYSTKRAMGEFERVRIEALSYDQIKV